MALMDKKTQNWRFVFMAGAVLMAALVGARVARSRSEPDRVENLIAYATVGSESEPNVIESQIEALQEVADSLKQKNLFVKAPKKVHPVQAVDGILGDEALIGDKWYKVGAKIADAEVVSIEPTHVTIKWDGKEKTFAPLSSGRNEASPSQRPTRPSRTVRTREMPEPEARSEEVAVQAVEPPADDDPLGWLGVELSPRARAKVMELWNRAPDQEKAKMREKWNAASDAERQEALASLEAM